jgi:hypothetical protein
MISTPAVVLPSSTRWFFLMQWEIRSIGLLR